MCVYIWTYARCEDPMAYFTRANLSNERSEKGIGSALVGGSGREREGALCPNYNTNHIESIIKAVEIY